MSETSATPRTTRRERLACARPAALIAALGAAAVVLLAGWLARDLPLRSPARIALATVQAATIAAVILVTLRGMRRLDELQRRIHLEALLLSFGGTGIVVTGWGFLELAGAPAVRWSLWVWPLMSVLWGAGLLVARRRYL